MFSKACEYAIRAVIYIAEQTKQHQRVSLKIISREIDSPIAYTSKILQQLTSAHIISSKQGMNGGYELDPADAKRITLLDVVKAIDGDKMFMSCGLGLRACDATRPCPLHHEFLIIREQIRDTLTNSSIESLSEAFHIQDLYLHR